MVPVLSLLIPIVVSAVFVFIASSVIHMATPFHKKDLKPLPDEEATMNALRALKIPPGDYAMPLARSMKDMGTPEFAAKMKAGPWRADQRPRRPGMGRTGAWFIYSLVVSMLASYVAGAALGPGARYLKVFRLPVRRVHRLRCRCRRTPSGGAKLGRRRVDDRRPRLRPPLQRHLRVAVAAMAVD
jgi:hypothetical protein